MDPVSRALATDLYELTMAASYLRRGMDRPATFSLFVRRLPPGRGFLVAAGLEDCLAGLESFALAPEDVSWLRAAGFPEDSVEALARLRFTGDVDAVPEGTVVLAGEPLLEVTAPLAEAQVVETLLLNQVTFQTAIAAKAARCRLGAAGRIQLVDFALRRTHGVDAGLAVARVSAIAGFAATSNVEAARRYGLAAAGTMAHSYVEAFPDERAAFRAFAEDHPQRATFLVDTYDTPGGVDAAVDVVRALGLTGPVGVRLDSGDVAALARQARARLDAAGLTDARIVVSGGIDEHELARFVADAVPVDVAGVGTLMGVSADAPYVDSVYKLVAYDGRPVLKLSTGKSTLPGPKQVWRRRPIEGDLLTGRDEPGPEGAEPLLVPVMRAGARTGPAMSIEESQGRLTRDLDDLPAAARALRGAVPPPVHVSPALAALTEEIASGHRVPPASRSG